MASTTARLASVSPGFDLRALGLVVVDVEAQDVAVFDGVGDGVGVQFLLEEVLRGPERLNVAFDALVAGVLLEDGRAGEAEELGVGEELLDGLVIVAELRAVALVEDKDHALVAERFEEVLVGRQALLFPALVSLAVLVERQPQLLNSADDDLVGGVVGKQTVDEGSGVGVLFDAAFLEAVELFAGLAVEVFAVDDEEALVDGGVGLEQRGGLEAGERFAAAGGVPDVAVAEVVFDALDDVLDGVDLVRPHHQQLLLAGDEDHVPADHLAEQALGEEGFGEGVEPLDLGVVGPGVLVDGQETLVGVEGEVAGVVVGEVVGAVAVGDDEELHEAEDRARVAVAGVVLVFDDLLDGAAGVDAEGFEFDLDGGDAVDEQDDVVAVVAVVGVDAELADDLEGVLAPVGDIDERVVQRGAVVAGEAAFRLRSVWAAVKTSGVTISSSRRWNSPFG
jgi:hypothetical protein